MEEKGGKIGESLAEVRAIFNTHKTRTIAWRKNQLRALIKLIHDNEDKIFKALFDDLGKHRMEAYRDEVYYIVNYITLISNRFR